jgi:hypothetical protein
MRPQLPALLLPGLLTATLAWSAPRVAPVAPPAATAAGEICVTNLPELPPGTDEVELFLVPEDGSGRALQVTPERRVTGEPLRWRMPRIAASHARLVLRAGGRWGESESEPSARFEVHPAASPGLAEVLRGRDELAWQFGERDGEAAALGSNGATTIGERGPLALAAEEAFAPEALLPATAHVVLAPRERVRPSPLSTRSPLRRPRFLPLLI